ncbi:hypothetical protein GOP47_0017225 [Adiantum capillus-veneris]|uniref:Late embryogenesis abundant protein LEA-2 subgroup domain-containing protein n=1 Tax=Adiantum capillus-veneris TaxID=13818 RepID=A0A9D4UJA1_ADICA|nr:hypothetical protein GOP47_0017225 [Adiantum capillus-veneris]
MGKGGKGSYKHRQKQKQMACMVVLALLVAVVALLAVLYFTNFRPRDPKVEVPTMQLLSLYTAGYPATVTSANLTLNLQLSLHNPNRAPFYLLGDSAASLLYYGSAVGSTPLPPATVLARSSIALSAAVTVEGPTPLGGPHIYADVASAALEVSTSVAIVGKVTTLNMFSHHAKVVSNCNVSISLSVRGIESFTCQKAVSVDT